MQNKVELLCDSLHGIYIPQIMIGRLIESSWSLANVGILSIQSLSDGPESEWYWEAWINVLDNTTYVDENGNVWTLYQNGDVFAVCLDLMTEEEKAEFFGDYG